MTRRKGNSLVKAIVGFFGCKPKTKVRMVVASIVVGTFFLGIVQYAFSVADRDYVAVPARITDISKESSFSTHGSKTSYKYTVIYEYDGTSYMKTMVSGSSPDKNLSKIWIDTENPYKVAVASTGEMILTSAYLFLGTVVSLIVWFILYKNAPSVPYSEEVALNVFIGSVMAAFLSAFGAGICMIDDDLAILILRYFSVALFVLSTLLAVMSKYEEKRMEGA